MVRSTMTTRPRMDTSPNNNHRPIRSFVRREGKLTKGQSKALKEHWVQYGIDASQQKINFQSLFGNQNPVVIEIGFGNGDNLFSSADRDRATNFVGIEVHRPGVGALLMKAQSIQLINLRVIVQDAIDILKHRIDNNSITEFRLYFPDPWHKKRHNKRRFVQAATVRMIAEKLKDQGRFHMATDWEDYANQMLRIADSETLLTNEQGKGVFASRPDSREKTKFERRGEALGHGVWDLIYKKVIS